MAIRELRVGDLVTHVYKGVNEEYKLGVVMMEESSIGLVRIKWFCGDESLHARYMLKWIA
jgi:hypothetical protein